MEGNLLSPYMVLIVQHMTETCDRYETVHLNVKSDEMFNVMPNQFNIQHTNIQTQTHVLSPCH